MLLLLYLKLMNRVQVDLPWSRWMLRQSTNCLQHWMSVRSGAKFSFLIHWQTTAQRMTEKLKGTAYIYCFFISLTYPKFRTELLKSDFNLIVFQHLWAYHPTTSSCKCCCSTFSGKSLDEVHGNASWRVRLCSNTDKEIGSSPGYFVVIWTWGNVH